MQTSQNIIKLSELQIGQKARLIKENNSPSFFKMLNMGATPGKEISVKHTGVFGDPILFKVEKLLLSLRKQDAQSIQVQLISARENQ